MNTKARIGLLFSAQSLFGESVEQTLSQVEDVEIAGHWPIDDEALNRVEIAHPDFVVFIQECATPAAFSHLTALILDRYPELPVFRVTLERNQMQVFSSHLVPARSADLIDLIHHLPIKSAGPGSGSMGREEP
jgi:DNA-binding NarL/FixJ family response regulator